MDEQERKERRKSSAFYLDLLQKTSEQAVLENSSTKKSPTGGDTSPSSGNISPISPLRSSSAPRQRPGQPLKRTESDNSNKRSSSSDRSQSTIRERRLSQDLTSTEEGNSWMAKIGRAKERFSPSNSASNSPKKPSRKSSSDPDLPSLKKEKRSSWLKTRGAAAARVKKEEDSAHNFSSPRTPADRKARHPTILHQAVHHKDIDLLKTFLKDPKIKTLLEETNSLGETALVVASYLTAEKTLTWPKGIRSLLKAGANPNAKDVTQRTPLHYAVTAKNERIIRTLLKYGADPRETDSERESSIAIARRINAPEIVSILINWNSNFLHQAVLRKDTKLLAQNLAKKMNLEELNNFQETPLAAAASLQDGNLYCRECVMLLLKAGARPNVLNKTGESPLFCALKAQDFGIAAMLLTHDADPALQNKDGEMPLNLASEDTNDIIRLLLTQNKKEKETL